MEIHYKVEAQIRVIKMCVSNELRLQGYELSDTKRPAFLPSRETFSTQGRSALLTYLITTELNNTDCKFKCGQILHMKVTNSNLG
jgi:hypothetical protein